MKILINLTNHASSKWSDKQKEGWDAIVDLPFPNINPKASTEEIQHLANTYLENIKDIANSTEGQIYLCLQGEYTFCYELLLKINSSKDLDNIKLAIPTTERNVIEKLKEDGTVEKVATFDFCQWRELPIHPSPSYQEELSL